MAKTKKASTSVEIHLNGGPRNGDTLRVANPPPPRIRLAIPEWCNYYRKGDSLLFEYDDTTPWVSLDYRDELK